MSVHLFHLQEGAPSVWHAESRERSLPGEISADQVSEKPRDMDTQVRLIFTSSSSSVMQAQLQGYALNSITLSR